MLLCCKDKIKKKTRALAEHVLKQPGGGGLECSVFPNRGVERETARNTHTTLKSISCVQVQMVSSMRVGRNMNYRVLDIDWCTSDKVVLASDDGCVRVLEMAMKSASYRMDEQDLTGEQKEMISTWFPQEGFII